MAELLDRLQQGLPKRYTLEREFRRGGMGTVYLAREEHPSRQVVIKVLDPDITARLGRERFLREIDLASNLTHPHIVPIFAAGEASGLLYYAMPYVDGESLAERIDRETQLPLEDALRIAYDVADALEYAHRRNVVHRDVKPGNILLQGDHALVTDFGVARAVSVAGGEPLTETGMALGTPAYMSPEQVTSETDVDGRTDVYALGCVLYEMLAGEPPFRGRDARVILARHMVDPVPPVRTVRDTVPVAVEQLITRALAKAPADRTPTAKQFAQSLTTARAELGSGWSTPLPSAGVAERQSRPTRWLKRAAMVAVALAIATLWWQPWSIPGGTVSAAGPRYLDSVAVMPIANLTGDPQYDHVSAGITQEIVHHLTQIAPLKVTSPHSVEALQGSGLTIPQLAESLDVAHVLKASLQLDRDRMRVAVQYIEAESDRVVWAENYVGDLDDPWEAQEEIARGVTARLVSSIGGLNQPDTMAHARHGPGHEAYLLGEHWLNRRTAEGLRRAIAAFGEAITLDSGFAPAYAGLSSAYALAVTYRYRVGIEGYRTAGLALAMAERAVTLDPVLAAGYAARGYIGALSNAPVQDVAADFRRAGVLQPNAPSIPSWSARVLAQMGRIDEAFAGAERAVSLDPLAAGRHIALSYLSLHMKRYALAISAAQKAVALEPELMLGRAIEARALLLSGQAEQCAAMALGPHAVLRATCFHELGRVDEARAIVDSVTRDLSSGQLTDSTFSDVTRAEDLAVYYAWIGDASASHTWLSRSYELSPTGVEIRVLESALFDRVREDRQFAEAVRRIRNGIWERVRAVDRRPSTP